MKPYYEASGITIYHGDCREILPQLPPCDLVLTDPPYNEVNRASAGIRTLDRGTADAELFPIFHLIPSLSGLCRGSLYVWCGIEQMSGIRAEFVNLGLGTRLCIWEKTNPSPLNGEYLWLSSIECCVFARKEKAVFQEFCASPVWRGPIAESSGHPTPKPEWLMRRLVLASSEENGLVLDPFMGGGTTLRAAKDTGRTAIGIEIEENYCEIAAKRLSQEVFDFRG